MNVKGFGLAPSYCGLEPPLRRRHEFLSFLFKMLLFLMKITHIQVLIKMNA